VVDEIERSVKPGLVTYEDVMHIKHNLQQLARKLDKFQHGKIDGIVTSTLQSGKEEARKQRKQLNGDVDTLRERVLLLLEKVNNESEALTEAMPLINSTRGKEDHSLQSVSVVQHLDQLQGEYEEEVAVVDEIERSVKPGLVTYEDVMHIKHNLQQLARKLDKFQHGKIDGIVTSTLQTGKEDAVTKRKRLNREVDNLRDRVLLLIEKVNNESDALIEATPLISSMRGREDNSLEEFCCLLS